MKGAFIEALRMKSGLVGFGILASLLAVTVITPLFAPFDVVRQWSNVDYWQDNPRWAAPEWVHYFTGRKDPTNTFFDPSTFRSVVTRTTTILPDGTTFNLTTVEASKKFFWDFDDFPSELSAYVTASFPGATPNVTGQSPFIVINWTRPDQQVINLVTRSIPGREQNVTTTYHFSSSTGAAQGVIRKIQNWVVREGVIPEPIVNNASVQPHVALFAQNDSAQLDPARSAHLLRGTYQLVVRYTGFGLTDTMSIGLKIYGTVFGLAGTDDQRRDLMTGLLWGAPVALAFGVAAAVVVVLIQTVLGAISGWYGGGIDEAIQRSAEVFLIIPILPILIIIQLVFHRPGIVAILFVVVAFGIVGSTTKVVRSIVLQIREEQFVEAAQSYGASRLRILFRYIMPRVMPYAFALVALSVPAFIFLEASLSFLGLGDPTLPTWGATLGNAYNGSALYYGYWWWVAFPTLGIVYTAIGFSLLGYAFDKVINPRLREE